MSHQDGSEKTGRPQPTAPASTPGHSHLLSLPSVVVFFLHMYPSGEMEGKHGSKRKGKHSEGINGSEGSGAEDDLGDGNQSWQEE